MIFQMPKRKRTLPTSSRTKRLRKGSTWAEIGQTFFHALEDPLGGMISLVKGDLPAWSKRGSKIVPFDNRKGFIGGLINSMGLNYLKDMLEGAVTAVSRNSAIKASVLAQDPRLLAYKLTHRFNNQPTRFYFTRNKSNMTHLPTDIRRSGIGETVYAILNNPTVRSIGKKAAIATATYALPRALDYFINRPKKRTLPARVEVMDEDMY